jgi:hypothetical protein
MSWWTTALYDPCSIITLDKLFLEQASLARHFPACILALEESFTAGQLRQETADRMRERMTLCPLPTLADLKDCLPSIQCCRALARIDQLVFAAAVHHQHAVVTANRWLARAIKSQGLQVGNLALVLRELVIAEKLKRKACEQLLVALATRKDYLLGTPTPTWAELKEHVFPD